MYNAPPISPAYIPIAVTLEWLTTSVIDGRSWLLAASSTAAIIARPDAPGRRGRVTEDVEHPRPSLRCGSDAIDDQSRADHGAIEDRDLRDVEERPEHLVSGHEAEASDGMVYEVNR